MKTPIVYLMVIFLLSGCGIYQTSLPHSESSMLIDFRKYTSKDFLFSSSNYNGNYQSIGILTSNIFPEVKLKSRGMKGENYDETKYTLFENFLVERVSFDDVLNKMYEDAKLKGANAIVNIEIRREQNPHYRPDPKNYYNPIMSVLSYGWVITGMAIKTIE